MDFEGGDGDIQRGNNGGNQQESLGGPVGRKGD